MKFLSSIHPKVYASVLAALAGGVITAVVQQCGGQQAIVYAALPALLAGVAGYLKSSGGGTATPPAAP